MTACWTTAYCAFKTLGKTAVFMSQWCTLQAFVQAAMWHNTEPKTLGISYWATGLFLGSICFPGLIYLIASLLFPATKSQSLQTGSGVSWLIRVTPATALSIAALPWFDDIPSGRTGALACGIVAINLYVILISWRPEETASANCLLRTVTSADRPKTATCCSIDAKRTKKIFQNSLMAGNVDSDGVIAVCATMAARWCFGSINVFYENWKVSLALMFLVHTYALVLFVWQQITTRCENFSPGFLTKFNKSKLPGGHVTNDEVETASKSKVDPVEKSGDNFLLTIELGYDATKEERNATGQSEVRPHSPTNEDTIFNSTAADVTCRRGHCSEAPYLCAFVYAFMIAPAVGSLTYKFLWIFTSPAILCLWGEVPSYPWGYLVLTSFATGCLLAIFVNTERLCTAEESQYGSKNEKLQEKRLRRWQCAVNLLISITVVLGTALTLYTDGAKFLFGASILCLISPLLLRTIMIMSYDLVIASKSLRFAGKRETINLLPGTLLTISGITFVAFHFISVMFISPQVTTVVHGKLGAIMWPEVILVVIPLICGQWIRSRIKVGDRLRSSSTGPLLESEPPNFAEKGNPNPDCEWTSAIGRRRVLKWRKISQIILIIFILVSAAVAQYCSQRFKSSCDTEPTVNSACDLRNRTPEYDLRVMSWNILLGHTMTGRSNLGAIAHFTDQYDPDILALQEATTHPAYWGGADVFGYVQSNTKTCRTAGKRINPRIGSLETGMLSRFEIIERTASVLPNGGVKKLPTYTMAKITCRIPAGCNLREEMGSGLIEGASFKRPSVFHIYTLHAVYKNWTCDRHSKLSCEQMRFVHEDIRDLPMDEPVVVMGDFNINPSEPELDIWFQGDLGFKSALWLARNRTRGNFNFSCEEPPNWDDDTCDCECRNGSSDPPNSTLLNRRAGVDHIFYRGLKLVDSAKILDDVGNVSDHYPILADFAFQ